METGDPNVVKILALDTATSACSVAFWADGEVVARRFAQMPRGQSEALLPMVSEVLDEAAVDWAGLDLLAVTVGPGAFTGLRIGLAAARGMALAAGLPCIGVTTLEAVAAGAVDDKGPLLVVLDAKRADVYAQAFDADHRPLGEPRALMPEALPGLIAQIGERPTVIGDAADLALDALAAAGLEARRGTASGIPDAAIVAVMAAEHWSSETPSPPPEPLYIRPPDAVKPRNGGRLRP